MFNSICVRCLPMALCLLVFMTGEQAIADETGGPGQSARPRIGLVLGGGGARGAAHVGVLQELQRLRIPVDAIAGTSMGAIVGGLYASGVSPDELAKLMRTLDWSEVMSDAPPRTDLGFRRKQDDVLYPIDLELGVRNGGLVLPKGMVQGQNLGILLRELTADVAHITNYDELPIPLRIVASDIENGNAHVMSSGDIAWSIRASMSVPGFIAPVRLDGRLLVDGGIVANLPIDVMRTMNVDIIIAVDVEFPLYPPEDLQSAPAITEQMLTILMRKETLRQISMLQPDDVFIRPDLGTFASSNFADAPEAMAKGREAIGQVEDRLRELSVDDQTYSAYVASLKPIRKKSAVLGFVRIEHDDGMATELLASRLGVFAGDEIDSRKLAEGAGRLYNLGTYELVNYRVVEEDGALGVVYTALPKSWGPDFLKVGVSVQDDLDGSTAFNVFGRLTKTGLNQRGAEWRTDFELGTNLSLLSEFYQPFGSGLKYFFAPHFDLQQRDQNVFVDDQSISQLRFFESELGFGLGAELGMLGEFRVGAYTGQGKTRVKIGDPAVPDQEFDLGAVFAQFRMDTLDDSRFPRSGIKAGIKWDWSRESLGADKNYDIFAADFLSVWSRGKSTLQFGLNYATSSDAEDQLQEYFPLGGFLRLSGLERGQISGPHAAMSRLVYYRLVSDYTGGLFEVPMYLGASLEAGNVWQARSDISFDSMLTSGSLFVGFDTYFGAIYLAAGLSEGGQQAFYLLIGSPPR